MESKGDCDCCTRLLKKSAADFREKLIFWPSYDAKQNIKKLEQLNNIQMNRGVGVYLSMEICTKSQCTLDML